MRVQSSGITLALLCGALLASAQTSTSAAIGFAPYTAYATGSGPSSVAVGDFNRDGKLDLAITNEFANTVSILLGHGDGSFQPHGDYAAGSTAFAVAVGDFNKDGNPDLAVANESGNSVSVLLSNGDGTFQAHVDYVAGSGARGVTVRDFNGDGNVDLGTANYYANTVSVLLGNGDGTFQAHMDYPTGAGPDTIVAADFNRDGKLDLATGSDVCCFDSGTLSVLLGKGDGTFQKPVNYGIAEVDSLAVGDLNSDGKLDLVAADYSISAAEVWLGNGDGTFQNNVNYGTDTHPNAVTLGDFNGNGALDMATPDINTNTVSVLAGNGDGTFQPYVDFSSGPFGAFSIATGDFNKDGALDLAITGVNGNVVSVLLNSGGTFVATTTSTNPSTLGQAVTFTTTVAASISGTGAPTGKVTFMDGAILIGSGTITNGVASFTTAKLNVGIHKIRSEYSGDGTFNPHKAVAIAQKVMH